MKQISWMILGWLLLASAQAASFDCAKAQAKVEHLICDNPEISKLDEELAAGYKAALQERVQAEAARREQKRWVKERNACADAGCVRGVYETRLSALTRGYTLMMSKDAKLCNSMLALYNGDMKAHGKIMYEQHEMFTKIKWQVDSELELTHAFFDINNDGENELVIRFDAMLRGIDIDNLLIYPAESNVLSKMKPGAGGLRGLFDTQNQLFSSGNQMYYLKDLPKMSEVDWVGGTFVLKPFIREGTSYISMTDQTPRWVVIAQYKQAEELQDICYFFNRNIEHPSYFFKPNIEHQR